MKRQRVVRFTPAIGSPVWLPAPIAERELAKDDDLYLRMRAAGVALVMPRIDR